MTKLKSAIFLPKALLCFIFLSFITLNNSVAFGQQKNLRDEVSLQQMEALAQQVDYFFTRLLSLPEAQRNYAASAKSYLEVEVNLNALKTRQQSRENNEQTLKQVGITTKLWQQDRKRHQAKDSFSDLLIKRYRLQYQRLFLAMIKVEEAKPVSN